MTAAMNDLQEVIIDSLIGAPASAFETASGPIDIALKALKEAQLTRRKDPAMVLGYPKLLCAAFSGASAGLASVDDRRQLAVTIFSDLPPRPQAPILSSRRVVEIALWSAQRVHPLVCRADCPHLESVSKNIIKELDNPAGSWSHVLSHTPFRQQCAADYSGFPKWHDQCGHAGEAMRHTAEACVASARTWPGVEAGTAVGSAARVPALVQGLAGAIDFCLALAKELGM
jgi:hypothetical protein